MNKVACDKPGCVCGIRCVACNHAFVERECDLCSHCVLVGVCCEFCKASSNRLYKKLTKDPKKFVPMFETNQCEGCGNIDATTIHHLCESCDKRSKVREYLLCASCFESSAHICKSCTRTVDVLVQGSICVPCYYSQGWEESSDMRARMCSNCQRYTFTDGTLCRDCFIKQQLSLDTVKLKTCECGTYISSNSIRCSRCENNLRKCVTCREPFVPPTNRSWQCHDCSPKCRSCGQKFDAENYLSKFCSSCQTSIDSDKCTNCGQYRALDSRGHCEDCGLPEIVESTEISFKCTRCGEFNMLKSFGICDNCTITPYTCPECNTNIIKGYEFLCKTCENRLKRKHIIP